MQKREYCYVCGTRLVEIPWKVVKQFNTKTGQEERFIYTYLRCPTRFWGRFHCNVVVVNGYEQSYD